MKCKLYKSECGEYICRCLGGGNFEAWTKDGKVYWANDDRERPGAEYPVPYGVGGYSAEQTGQKKGSFTLSLLYCDVTIKIIPFGGNTIIESRDVVFRRKIPYQNTPRWLRTVTA